jgi:hypothetical protein
VAGVNFLNLGPRLGRFVIGFVFGFVGGRRLGDVGQQGLANLS